MLCLPSVVDQEEWRLPMSEPAARLLALKRLQIEDACLKQDEIRRLLICDPALCIWCVSQMRKAKSVDDVAQWLTDAEPRLVSRKENKSPQEVSHFRRLAELSVAAWKQRRIKRKGLRNQLGALLHNAEDWCAPTILDAMPSRIRKAICSNASFRKTDSYAMLLPSKWRSRVHQVWNDSDTSAWSKLLHTLISRSESASALDEKLAAIRQLAYGASHEINNPLANISTRAQNLMRTTSDESLVKNLAAINHQAFRAHEMLADLMYFAKPPAIEPSSIRLDEMLGDILLRLKQSLEISTDVAVYFSHRPITLECDPAQIALALTSILQNACEALRGVGNVWVRMSSVQANGTASYARISIRDDGPGLSEEARSHLYDPFFSGREAGRGLGFGLSKAWRIVNNHGGKLIANCPSDGGAEFLMELPLQAEN